MSFRKLAKINFTARMWDGPLQPLHSTSLRWTQWQDASTADPRRRLALEDAPQLGHNLIMV